MFQNIIIISIVVTTYASRLFSDKTTRNTATAAIWTSHNRRAQPLHGRPHSDHAYNAYLTALVWITLDRLHTPPVKPDTFESNDSVAL